MSTRFHDSGAPVERLTVAAYTVPTASPESDGTLAWDHTTLVLVTVAGGGREGLGYTYADVSAARFIESVLRAQVLGGNALDVPGIWARMRHAIRNLGRPGITSTAISAVDLALWDLKARLLDLPLAMLLGRVHDAVPVYGSGGFTSYSMNELEKQLGGWVAQGIPRVKMKVGRDPKADVERVRAVRGLIGPETQLFVDANGAYGRKQALEQAHRFAEYGVVWFEEPVSSDDLEGLRLLRDQGPPGMDITAGEYGYDLFYFRRMLDAGAVDVLQADGSRCGGVTEFLRVDALCQARPLPLSAHTAPMLHLHVGCASASLRHLEYFFDHVRIEQMLFDGVVEPVDGKLHPDLSRPGLGLEFKRADAARFAV